MLLFDTGHFKREWSEEIFFRPFVKYNSTLPENFFSSARFYFCITIFC